MRKVRVQDLVAQSVVSILNLSYRRIAKEDERDLEQARVGIEAIRGMVDVLDEESQREIRNALSQVQMLYAQASGGAAEPGPAQPPEAPRPRAALRLPVEASRRRGSGRRARTEPERRPNRAPPPRRGMLRRLLVPFPTLERGAASS